MRSIENVTVIGAGAMGHGIAQSLAVAGYQVIMNDVQQTYLDNGLSKIKKNMGFLTGKGKMTPQAAEESLGRIHINTDLKTAVADAQLVIEAVPEILDLKKKIFATVSAHAEPAAILATNTSTMSISVIAEEVTHPERFLGMHFFNPADRMKLVEVVNGRQTHNPHAEAICEVVRRMKKIPIRVLKDSPGFIVNRISAPNQAFLSAILDEGKIRPDAVDNMMKKVGQPMGPFELADFVGLDVFCHTLAYYHDHLSAEYNPGRYLKEKLQQQALGAKTGQGIYQWVGGKALIDTTQSTGELSPMEFLAIQMNEAVRVFKEGIAASTSDIDQAIVHGMRAFAGPFAICAGVGHQDLTIALEKIRKRFGLAIFQPEAEIVDGSFKQLSAN